MKEALAIPLLALLLAGVIYWLHPPTESPVRSVRWSERRPGLLVDARTAEEFNRGHLPGALSWPVESAQMPDEIKHSTMPVTIYATRLSPARALFQGRRIYQARGQPVEVVVDPPL